MKQFILTLLILSLGTCGGCKSYAGKIPTGTWHYKLIMNSTEIGTASVNNSIENGNYKIKTEMKMNIGPVTNTMTQIVTETQDFKPVSININNVISNNGDTQTITTSASFNKNTVTITSGGVSAIVNISGDFHLDGNYMLSRLIKNKFEKNIEMSALIYDPSLEPEEAVRIKAEVVGEETVSINNKTESLIHISQSIEGFKNIDIYMDAQGVVKKAVILMLNNRIEMIITD